MRRRLVLLAALAAATAIAPASVAPAPGPAQRVAVTLKEFTIGVPLKLKPGWTTFLIRNRGQYPHNFVAIWGPVRFAGKTIGPGETTRLTVDLVPGAYVAACTVLDGGHIARGMVRIFTIGSRSPGSASWHYP